MAWMLGLVTIRRQAMKGSTAPNQSAFKCAAASTWFRSASGWRETHPFAGKPGSACTAIGGHECGGDGECSMYMAHGVARWRLTRIISSTEHGLLLITSRVGTFFY